jgi:hypothetical protein
MTFEIVNSVPIPYQHRTTSHSLKLIDIAGRLSATDNRFAKWAKAVGVSVGSVESPIEREELEIELDALVAHLYGLNRDHVQHIFKTFHRGWDFTPRLERVLTYFDNIERL